MSLGKAVLRIRHGKKLTQRALGKRAGLATSYISRIENDRLQPTMPTLQRIATAMGVSMAEIFATEEGTGQPSVQRCPVSGSGHCVGEMIRSGKGRRPAGSSAEYGPEEIRILRMADYVILHAAKDVRGALAVILEAMLARTRGHAAVPS